jgi:hypothetical protein
LFDPSQYPSLLIILSEKIKLSLQAVPDCKHTERFDYENPSTLKAALNEMTGKYRVGLSSPK